MIAFSAGPGCAGKPVNPGVKPCSLSAENPQALICGEEIYPISSGWECFRDEDLEKLIHYCRGRIR